jgi:hypothetical protein
MNQTPVTRVCHLPDKRATVVASRAEQYRRLADECLMLANLLPAGERGSVIAMAQTWQRLAEEQDHATDLRLKDEDKKD